MIMPRGASGGSFSNGLQTWRITETVLLCTAGVASLACSTCGNGSHSETCALKFILALRL